MYKKRLLSIEDDVCVRKIAPHEQPICDKN